MASIPPDIHNLDAAHISTWRPFHLTSPIWTPPTSAHGVHSAPHPQSGRRLITTLASIPPHIHNLDAAQTLPTPAHGSIPLNIPDLDAAHSSTWRPFRPTSLIWTPHTPAHGVHSSQHPRSGRHPNSHMASIPLNIPNLDAAHSNTWRPFCPTSQIWTLLTPAHGVHSAQHPQSGRSTDAAQTQHRRSTDAAQTQPARGTFIFQKIPLSDIKMHNFIPLLKSDESYCTMALTTI